MQHALKAIIFCLIVASCGHTRTTVVNPVSDVVISRPQPPSIEPPRFIIVNRENFDQLRSMVESGQIIIVLTLEEFNQLLENNQQIIVFLAGQNLVLDQYEERLTAPNS